MNTHNDFLNNTMDDELETDGIENSIAEVCSHMQNDMGKMCLSLRNEVPCARVQAGTGQKVSVTVTATVRYQTNYSVIVIISAAWKRAVIF